MSLPREPRQKMINMMYLVLTALLALNVSAEILNAFKTVRASLEKTNDTVNVSTQSIITSLELKKTEEATREKAGIWEPKAKQVVQYSSDVFNYIEGLKNQIITEAGGDPKDPNKRFKEENQDIATRILVEKNGGKELLKKLGDYKKNVLAVDPLINSKFANTLPINLEIPSTQSKVRTWEAAYFRMVPTVAALTILAKFQNDIKTTENNVVTFCHEQVGKVELRFDAFEAIVGQNSKYFMPGQEIEVTAGLGAFSKTKLPDVYVQGAKVTLNEKGMAVYKTAAGAIGNHTIPVKVTFTDQDGKPQERTFNVEYTVGQSNASIALDKMNVLYIGVDNPITIAASGGGDDKVSVSMTGTGGSISKAGAGKYIAKVTTQTNDCRITVTVDGKVAGVSTFRVRQIPGSVATVGGFASGDNVPAATFRAQGGVAAWIKDFPFELKYQVTQYTISTDTDDGDIAEAVMTGNAFAGRAADLIKTHVKAGKTVYIDNIRAVGEDGQTKKVPSLVYYIK